MLKLITNIGLSIGLTLLVHAIKNKRVKDLKPVADKWYDVYRTWESYAVNKEITVNETERLVEMVQEAGRFTLDYL